MAVYVLSEWPEDCMACKVNSDCETRITSKGECPLRKAIALVEPNGHLIYLGEATDSRACVARGIDPAENNEPCIGYGISENDDEPCEMCKQCPICDGNGEVEV